MTSSCVISYECVGRYLGVWDALVDALIDG